ncbi:hypothetical protein ACFY2R_16150 [Micromonospora olivasterospora]|uniref:Uncharacterized protein n=1 Tax=Micromonospora olivasterospora TaxID=1880 RepID=A0A562IA26_MICOL|nr:hypothetical protein [Micromonospora olivasterospora]TWH67847.1 hypothetical protein JD77_02832 [Micromonospora olivasterospora]
MSGTGQRSQGGFPRRDAEGRVVAYGDLLGIGLAGVVIGLLALLVFDWGFATVGAGEFGFARVAAALTAGVVAVLGGMLLIGQVAGLPPLLSGGLAAAAFTLLYATVWFHGVRWLGRRTG